MKKSFVQNSKTLDFEPKQQRRSGSFSSDKDKWVAFQLQDTRLRQTNTFQLRSLKPRPIHTNMLRFLLFLRPSHTMQRPLVAGTNTTVVKLTGCQMLAETIFNLSVLTSIGNDRTPISATMKAVLTIRGPNIPLPYIQRIRVIAVVGEECG
jgi:hypothetical protein